jgi:hypothetical protein
MNVIHVLDFQDWERIQESEKVHLDRLNEDANVSGVLHTIGDVVSAASDCIWPGSGAVVDIVQAITYFLESSLAKDYAESSGLFIGGIVSLASLALVGPMQALAAEAQVLLRTVRKGISKGATRVQIASARIASTKLVKFLQGISSSMSLIASKIIDLVKTASETKLGSWIIKKFGTINAFSTWANKFFKVTILGNLNKFIGYLARLNPASAVGSIEDSTIQKFGREYTKGQSQETIGEDILTKGTEEVKLSGIPPSLKYTKRNFGSPEQEFQRDTTGDQILPYQIKRNS